MNSKICINLPSKEGTWAKFPMRHNNLKLILKDNETLKSINSTTSHLNFIVPQFMKHKHANDHKYAIN